MEGGVSVKVLERVLVVSGGITEDDLKSCGNRSYSVEGLFERVMKVQRARNDVVWVHPL